MTRKSTLSILKDTGVRFQEDGLGRVILTYQDWHRLMELVQTPERCVEHLHLFASGLERDDAFQFSKAFIEGHNALWSTRNGVDIR